MATKKEILGATVALAVGLMLVWLYALIVYYMWQGFSTAATIKHAQEQAFEQSIKRDGCKLTGYYKRSSARMFVCVDGNTYKEDSINLMLKRVY